MRIKEFIKLPLLFVVLLVLSRCGKVPLPLPLSVTGSIRITVEGAAAGDSVRIVLDDKEMGKYQNFSVLPQVVIGFHKLFVLVGNTATPPQIVEVRRGETLPVKFRITAIGPYVGNQAPMFDVKSIRGDSISLSKQKGKVVLLVFFEHT